jgi:hypothetical protein
MSAAGSSERTIFPVKPRAASAPVNSVMAARADIRMRLAPESGVVLAGTANQTALPRTCQPASRALVRW